LGLDNLEINSWRFASTSHAVAEAMDTINDKYGEFVITPALMMGMDETIIDRIAFEGVREMHEETTCQQAVNLFLYGTGR
jgi:hypothetical protein